VPYRTETNTTISLLEKGDVAAENMFEAAQSRNSTLTWILRLVGFMMMFFGIKMCFNPFVILADVIPFLGSVLGGGVSIFAGLVAVILTLITIALAWVAARPILGFTLLGIAGAAAVFLFIRSKKNKQASS
jgi:hypothetical protein